MNPGLETKMIRIFPTPLPGCHQCFVSYAKEGKSSGEPSPLTWGSGNTASVRVQQASAEMACSLGKPWLPILPLPPHMLPAASLGLAMPIIRVTDGSGSRATGVSFLNCEWSKEKQGE